jgi:hypothetical protein
MHQTDVDKIQEITIDKFIEMTKLPYNHALGIFKVLSKGEKKGTAYVAKLYDVKQFIKNHLDETVTQPVN